MYTFILTIAAKMIKHTRYVSYPSAPLFLLYNTEFVKGMLRPIFQYASSPEGLLILLLTMCSNIRFLNGQVYALESWPLLEKWAQYLLKTGMDPENQLCTDDFAGHLAHNCNLSIKAIMGITGFAILCSMNGEEKQADELMTEARK